MTESPIVRAIVWSVDEVTRSADVIVDGVFTKVFPQDGALPEPGQFISCVRNGADLIPIANSQRMEGTLRGAVEAESFIGTSSTVIDVWDDPWNWSPLSGTIVAQPTEGVDPATMRLTRSAVSAGRVRASITIPVGESSRWIAMELSAPPASSTGRDAYAELKYMFNASTLATHTLHLNNLFLDPRSVQTPPVFPPPFTTHIKVDVYSEATNLTTGQFMDVRVRVWTVPVFQGGALLNLEKDVLMDHRGLIVGGHPVNEANRTVTIVAGTQAAFPGTPSPSNANVLNFPALSSTSLFRYKMLSGVDCKVKLTARASGAAPASDQMAFKVPFIAADHEVLVATYLDVGNRWHNGTARIDAGTNIAYLTHNESTNFGNVDESSPFTFGNGDLIIVSGVYEIQS